MLYAWLSWCARRALQWCYRDVAVVGTVPVEGPVLLAVNHPNEMPDICLVLACIPRRVAFVANVTAAEEPLVKWAYDQMGVVPVHRVRDVRKAKARGEDSAQANARAFAAVRDLLARGQCVCVFPEGGVHRGPQLGGLRTGLARMALDARDNAGVRGLQVVPVGITYEAPGALRSRVLVEIGDPVALDAWRADSARPADLQLTELVGRRMRRVTRNAPTEAAAFALRAVADLVAPPLLAGTELWQSLAADLWGDGLAPHALDDSRLEQARALAERLDAPDLPAPRTRLLAAWHAEEARRRGIVGSAFGSAAAFLREWLIGAPLAAVGLAVHAPAWWLIDRLARKSATHPDDVMARRIIPGLYVMVCWYGLLVLVGWAKLAWLSTLTLDSAHPVLTIVAALAFMPLIPALGTFGLRWRDRRHDRQLHAALRQAEPNFAERLRDAVNAAKTSRMPPLPSPESPSSV